MKPKPFKRHRVYYRHNIVMQGWAYPDTIRSVKNISGQVIRQEILVEWDHTWPMGYIHDRHIVKMK